MTDATHYKIEGSYYEACNCEAICPCRKQNGVADGRSTYGICEFLLSWHIKSGASDGIDLADLAVCMAGRYNDDEDGQPWSVHIYIDERAKDNQFEQLGEIFQGNAKGDILFTGRISKVLGISRAKIDLNHFAGGEYIRIGDIGNANVIRNFDFDGTVSCGIPGHDHPGQESVSSLTHQDGSLQWDYQERCGFATDFAYRS